MNRLSLNSKKMKFNKVIKLSAVAVLLSLSVVGCKKGLDKTTPLPGHGTVSVGTPDVAPPIGDAGRTTPPPPIDNNTTAIKPPDVVPISAPVQPQGDPNKVTALNGNLSTWGAAADQPFKSETVYFEFDKSTVKPG